MQFLKSKKGGIFLRKYLGVKHFQDFHIGNDTEKVEQLADTASIFIGSPLSKRSKKRLEKTHSKPRKK